MIDIHDLHFAWPRAANDTLRIRSLHIAAGEAVFVHGPSGCGKSTLLGLLAGVLVPTAGEVRLLGQPWSALNGAERDRLRADHVGYLFQQFNLLPYLSVLDNVRLPCRFSARRAERAGDVAAVSRRLLQQLELPADCWDRRADTLSVGQQQRVAAARALIGTPELVIADEPTSALDTALRDGFMAALRAQCQAAGSTLVFVSHDERLAEHFARRLSLPDINEARP
ncbi:MAG: ABC transporter ATP-binding protein [Rubrivivax sp.]|nr:ABC transporter ATP-binding protein [Rubrivivax sp.]